MTEKKIWHWSSEPYWMQQAWVSSSGYVDSYWLYLPYWGA